MLTGLGLARDLKAKHPVFCCLLSSSTTVLEYQLPVRAGTGEVDY